MLICSRLASPRRRGWSQRRDILASTKQFAVAKERLRRSEAQERKVELSGSPRRRKEAIEDNSPVCQGEEAFAAVKDSGLDRKQRFLSPSLAHFPLPINR